MFTSVAALALTITLQSAPATPAPPAPSAAPPTPSAAPPAPVVEPLPPDRPIVELFQNLGRDIVHLPSLDTFVLLGGGAAAGAIAHHNDVPLADWAARQPSAGYASFGSAFGDGWTQGSGAIGVYLIGLVAHDRLTTHVGSDLIRAQVLNAVLTRGIKPIVGRRRPGGGPDSMPSGHTTATFASAAVLNDHFGWKAGVPAFAMASFVGWSRVRDRAHWLSDVIVGASIGTIAGHTVSAGHRGRPWTIVPVASSKSVAIYYVR